MTRLRRVTPLTEEALDRLLRDHQPVHQGASTLVCAKCRSQGRPHAEVWPCPIILGVVHHPECPEELLIELARRDSDPRVLVSRGLRQIVATAPACPDWLQVEIALGR